MTSITILLAAALTGFVHTVAGPDHYLPFIVMSKARNWSLKQTLFITFCCGLGHIVSTIIIGFVGIALGYGIAHIEGVDSIRGNLAGWMLLIFGLVYMIWGITYAKRKSITTETNSLENININSKSTQLLTPWVLFIIFVFGPCEILIPLVMIPAASQSPEGIIGVLLVFSFVTILTMCAVVALGYYGFKFLKTAKIDKYMHAIAGATLFISGLVLLLII